MNITLRRSRRNVIFILMKFGETIDAEQKRIEKWKELKKGLLQQMFV